MIDIRRVRADLAGARAAMARRHDPSLLDDLDALASLDERARVLTSARDDIRARVNAASKAVAAAYKAGDRAAGDAHKEESRSLGDEEKRLTGE